MGTKANFQIYPDQFWAGFQERLAQVVDVFNASSAGALVLVARQIKGDFEKESFMKRVNGLIAHRDPTVETSVADKSMDQGQFVRPKINRRIGPVKQTRDSWKKIGDDPRVFSFLLGRQIAEDVAEDYTDTILHAIVAALSGVANLYEDASSSASLTHKLLNKGRFKLGDRAGRISAWAMHSSSMAGLTDHALGERMDSVAGTVIYGGGPGTFGLPVVVTDSAALYNPDAYDSDGDGVADTDTFNTLGLVDAAGAVIESESREIESETVLGEENLAERVQGEYAFNIEVRGFAFNEAAVNPDEATYSDPNNWTQVVASHKNCAGVLVEHQ